MQRTLFLLSDICQVVPKDSLHNVGYNGTFLVDLLCLAHIPESIFALSLLQLSLHLFSLRTQCLYQTNIDTNTFQKVRL
jgi:hypothetical protein